MKKIIIIILVLIVGIQFFKIDTQNPPVVEQENFVSIYKTPKSVEHILRKACYDCHSNETKYPKYATIAPISWAIKRHINEGREHLNFSTWARYNNDQKDSRLEKSITEIQELKMPVGAYIAQHPEANLTAEERKILVEYFAKIKELKN